MSTADAAAAPKRSALVVTTVSSFLTPLMASSVNIALPAIAASLRMDAVAMSWVTTTYLLAAAMFLVPCGKLADIHGRKRVFTIGISIYTAASLSAALSTTAAMLLVSRFVQGTGAAMIFGTAVAILTSVYPPGERGRVLGINVTAVYAGLAAGPFIGGILTAHVGWRSIFFLNVPLGLLILAAVLWKLDGEWADSRGERLDGFGAALLAVSLAVLMFGFSRMSAPLGAVLAGGGAAGIASFILWEMRASCPLINMDLFRKSTVFTFSNLAALVNYSATSAVGFLLSLYLQYVKGLAADTAGWVLVAQPLTMAVLSPFAGKLSDRIEPRLVASAGMAVTVAGLIAFAFIGAGTGLVAILAILVILGVGFAFFSSPNTNAVMSSVESRHYGVASATLGTMRLMGQMLSMGIALLVIASKVGRVAITSAHHARFIEAMRISAAVFAALCVFGVFASLARGRVR